MNVTLAPLLLTRRFPRLHAALADWLLVVGGSLLVALLAQVRIPLPFTPVPLTGQTFAVLLVGALLGARRGAWSLALYLLQGALGAPVFAGGKAGLVHLFGPTGGYLLGFLAAAWLVGWFAERGGERRLPISLLTFLLGEAVIYLFGLPWLAFFVGWERVLIAGLLPFLPGDLIKVIAAALALPAAWRLLAPWADGSSRA